MSDKNISFFNRFEAGIQAYSADRKFSRNARLGLTNPKHFGRICQSAGSGRSTDIQSRAPNQVFDTIYNAVFNPSEKNLKKKCPGKPLYCIYYIQRMNRLTEIFLLDFQFQKNCRQYRILIFLNSKPHYRTIFFKPFFCNRHKTACKAVLQ